MEPEHIARNNEKSRETQARGSRSAQLEAVYTWVMEHDAEAMRRLADA